MELTKSKWKYFTVFNLKELLTVKVKRKGYRQAKKFRELIETKRNFSFQPNGSDQQCMVVEQRMLDYGEIFQNSF